MRYLSRHTNALTQGRVCMYGFADINRISTHLDGQYDLADHVACVGADHTHTLLHLRLAVCSAQRPKS